MKSRRLIDKKNKKRVEGKCCFCDCDDYSVLDVHRWCIEGVDGGKYDNWNSLVCCANCHRKCHSGVIRIIGRHFSTSGKYILNYIEDGEEKWK